VYQQTGHFDPEGLCQPYNREMSEKLTVNTNGDIILGVGNK